MKNENMTVISKVKKVPFFSSRSDAVQSTAIAANAAAVAVYLAANVMRV